MQPVGQRSDFSREVALGRLETTMVPGRSKTNSVDFVRIDNCPETPSAGHDFKVGGEIRANPLVPGVSEEVTSTINSVEPLLKTGKVAPKQSSGKSFDRGSFRPETWFLLTMTDPW